MLVRHGKSDWENDLPDTDRPLSARGLKEVPIVGKMMVKEGIQPDLILSSPTLRTRQTTELLITALNIKSPSVIWDTNLYNQSYKFIFHLLKRLESNVKCPMIVAHDTFLAELVEFLTGHKITKFFTSACAVIHLNIENWSEMKESQNQLVHFLHPPKK